MRHPVDRNGLAVPIWELGYEEVPHKRGETNRHHWQYERAKYKTPLEIAFRGLASRVSDMRIRDHVDLHNRFSAPKLPTNVQMIDCLEEYITEHGVLHIVRERKTWEIHEVDPYQWESIKRGAYGSQQMDSRGDSLPSIESRPIYQRAS